jgi:vitamin B12 transporter
MKKNFLSVAASLGFAQLALFSTVAIAQEEPVRSLDEVVVTANRSARKLTDVGRVVRIISAQQLERNQGRTLTEVLNNIAGINLSGTGNNMGSNVSLFTRGATAGNTLILIDGIPVNNASGITGEYDITSFAIDQIERIEILRGANSTLYGSDAVAGVINIITKKPLSGKLNASLQGTSGSYNTFRQAIGLNGTFGETGIAFNFSNTSSDGISISKDKSGTGSFENDGFKQFAFTTDIKQTFSDQFSVSAHVQAGQNYFDLDGGAFIDDIDFKAKNTAFFGGLNGKYLLPKGDLNLIFNQNNVFNSFVDQTGSTGDFSRQKNEGKISYFEGILNQQLSTAINLIAGANYRHIRSEQLFESISPLYGVFNAYLPLSKNNIFSTYADLFFKANNFNLDLGGRYTNHSVYGSNNTFTINPSYVLNNRYKFFASVASGYKIPSIYQLYSEYGNLGLKPEKSLTYEVGFDFDLLPSKLSLSTSFFKRDINELIYFYSDPVTFASQYLNGYKQNDTGFEVEMIARPTAKLDISAWFAYVKGEGQNSAGDNITYLLRRPKNTFGATAGYQISNALSFNLIYKYTGDRLDPYYDSTILSTVNINQQEFSMFDIYLQAKPRGNLTIFADIKNILNEQYTEWEGYNTKGRNFNAGLRYEIK